MGCEDSCLGDAHKYCPTCKNYLNNSFQVWIGNFLPELIAKNYLSVIFFQLADFTESKTRTRKLPNWKLPKIIIWAPKSVISYLKRPQDNKFRAGKFRESDSVWLALCLSGPLRLRVQSRSRTRLRIAASIAFLFRACFKGVLGTIAPLSRGWAP